MNLTKRVQSMHDFFNEHIGDYDDKHAPLMKSKEDMIAAARADEKIKPWIDGKTTVKEIAVPGKLVNIVVR